MRAVAAAGIGFHIARLWTGGTRYFERRLKVRGAARLCPACVGDQAYAEGLYRPRKTEPGDLRVDRSACVRGSDRAKVVQAALTSPDRLFRPLTPVILSLG